MEPLLSPQRVVDWLEKEQNKEHDNKPHYGHIVFAKSSQTNKTQTSQRPSTLDGLLAGTWKLTCGKDLFFPNMEQTTLRPDIVLWSKTGKKLIVIKLTVPWQINCEEAYERKKAKYTGLLGLY